MNLSSLRLLEHGGTDSEVGNKPLATLCYISSLTLPSSSCYFYCYSYSRFPFLSLCLLCPCCLLYTCQCNSSLASSLKANPKYSSRHVMRSRDWEGSVPLRCNSFLCLQLIATPTFTIFLGMSEEERAAKAARAKALVRSKLPALSDPAYILLHSSPKSGSRRKLRKPLQRSRNQWQRPLIYPQERSHQHQNQRVTWPTCRYISIALARKLQLEVQGLLNHFQ